MGYESRVYIMRKSNSMGGFAEEIAKFNCRGMSGNGWRELFSKPIDYKIFADDGNTEFDEDKYGEHLKYADFPTVIAWLEREVEKEDYRRLKPLLSLLKGFDLSQWTDGEMQIVHYGY
ncbi:MAG: hypothetical protein HFH72_09090 [Lachnospiraceae bacterium]|nr:hypothetical protein [Lachnospiraceae bacterium]